MQHAGGSPQQFCLRWNNYQSNLTNVFDQLLQSESFVDVTLACDGHSVKAHKMVLSACSPYFQTLFFENPCQHPIVIMRDIKWPELKAVVEFMYKGEINVSQEQIGPLLKVAESLKIRGLADVNGEHDVIAPTTSSNEVTAIRPSSVKPPQTPESWPEHRQTMQDPDKPRKRRRPSGERSSLSSPAESGSAEMAEPAASVEMSPAPPVTPLPPTSVGSVEPLPLTLPLPSQQQVSHSSASDDMEIKPGIAEMIREEERIEPLGAPIGAPLAKLLESSHAWLGASTSSIAADSYQYQLQSMWQKCWNTNQSLVHNLRFRERGPLKSWRPETMAEAIFSVLKEGLSLSQAARKYDIPYPTFVLYANRVHNMLGPSADGGSDLRPKGRGRPQRILLGVWPDEHIRGVIRAVVFRDSHQIKEEAHMPYPRLHHPPFQDGVTVQSYQSGAPSVPCSNGGADAAASAGAAASAAIAAVAQGLRQQMCSMVAAAAHHGQGAAGAAAHDAAAGPAAVASLVNSLALAGHCGAPPLPTSAANGAGGPPTITTSSRGPIPSPGAGSVQDLRVSPAGSALDSPLSSPLGLTVSGAMEPALNMNIGSAMDVGIGVSGMTYKPPSRSFASPRPENLFQEDIDDLVKPMHGSGGRPKDPMATTIKIEPLQECRGD